MTCITFIYLVLLIPSKESWCISKQQALDGKRSQNVQYILSPLRAIFQNLGDKDLKMDNISSLLYVPMVTDELPRQRNMCLIQATSIIMVLTRIRFLITHTFAHSFVFGKVISDSAPGMTDAPNRFFFLIIFWGVRSYSVLRSSRPSIMPQQSITCLFLHFKMQAPVIWNQLPVSVRHSTSSLKAFLFLKTSSSVSLP